MFKSFTYKISSNKKSKVSIIRPSILWVMSERSKLVINNKVTYLNPGELLLINNHCTLNFEDNPSNKVLMSHQISFFSTPEKELLSLSKNTMQFDFVEPIIKLTPSIKQILFLTHELDTKYISDNVQNTLTNALYIQLAENGLLHLLFQSEKILFEKKLFDLFSIEPSYKHNINNSCNHLGVSRATLIRRLRRSNMTYKKLLRQVRMNHAINLIHQGEISITNIALDCGYYSNHRFNNYFKEQFGMSVKDYIFKSSVNDS